MAQAQLTKVQSDLLTHTRDVLGIPGSNDLAADMNKATQLLAGIISQNSSTEEGAPEEPHLFVNGYTETDGQELLARIEKFKESKKFGELNGFYIADSAAPDITGMNTAGVVLRNRTKGIPASITGSREGVKALLDEKKGLLYTAPQIIEAMNELARPAPAPQVKVDLPKEEPSKKKTAVPAPAPRPMTTWDKTKFALSGLASAGMPGLVTNLAIVNTPSVPKKPSQPAAPRTARPPAPQAAPPPADPQQPPAPAAGASDTTGKPPEKKDETPATAPANPTPAEVNSAAGLLFKTLTDINPALNRKVAETLKQKKEENRGQGALPMLMDFFMGDQSIPKPTGNSWEWGKGCQKSFDKTFSAIITTMGIKWKGPYKPELGQILVDSYDTWHDKFPEQVKKKDLQDIITQANILYNAGKMSSSNIEPVGAGSILGRLGSILEFFRDLFGGAKSKIGGFFDRIGKAFTQVKSEIDDIKTSVEDRIAGNEPAAGSNSDIGTRIKNVGLKLWNAVTGKGEPEAPAAPAGTEEPAASKPEDQKPEEEPKKQSALAPVSLTPGGGAPEGLTPAFTAVADNGLYASLGAPNVSINNHFRRDEFEACKMDVLGCPPPPGTQPAPALRPDAPVRPS